MVSNTVKSGPRPDDQYVSDRIGVLNSQRITWLIPILLLIHVAHIAIFWPYTPGASDPRHLWRNGIILVHGTMSVVAALLLVVKLVLERRKRLSGTGLVIMSEMFGLLYLLFAAVTAMIDQRITANITPLLVACMAVGIVLATRPVVAAFNYAFVFAVFSVGVAWTQTNPDLLLTVRVNSITATGLGFGMAVLQWRIQVVTIRQQRQIQEQQDELEQKNRELTLLATRDVMTGLLNRAQFMLEANREVARMRRTGSAACLITFDVDHFKWVNDTYGHPVGDSILVAIADMLKDSLRANDLVARFGGEEFAVLLPDTSLEEGVHVAEKLRAAIEERPVLVGTKTVKVTASFGVAALSTESGDTLAECYRAADRALYMAKGDGRNCVRSAQ